MRGALTVLAALMCAASALAGEYQPPKDVPVKADQVRARAIVLRARDLRGHWRASKPNVGAASGASCPGLDLDASGDEVELAAMELAEKVVGDATAVTVDDIDRLRTLGLEDAEILDIVAAAAVRCFFSKTLDALGVLPDAVFAELQPELRDALAVGRPIASA